MYSGSARELEEQLVAVKVAMHDCQAEELDIESALSFACFLMANAKSLYVQLSVETEAAPAGGSKSARFSLDEKEGFRTVASDCLLNGLYEAAGVLVKDGVTHGI